MMIGALLGASVLNMTTDLAVMPAAAKVTAQIVAGGFIGAGVSREELRRMRSLIRPALIVMPGLLLINLTAGFLIRASGPMDLLTAFISCAPGGISDMPMIAADLGADAATVAIMQFVRFLMGIALFPSLIRLITRRERAQALPGDLPGHAKQPVSLKGTVLTLLAAGAAGLVGRASPMPSGTIAFAMFGSMALRYFYPQAQVPGPLRKAAQCLSGAYVGAGIGLAQLVRVPDLIVPIVILLACYLLGAFLISALLVKTGCFRRAEAMLAATPAGASDMALISADMGISNIKLVLIQVLRLIVVISFFPTILSFVANVFGP